MDSGHMLSPDPQALLFPPMSTIASPTRRDCLLTVLLVWVMEKERPCLEEESGGEAGSHASGALLRFQVQKAGGGGGQDATWDWMVLDMWRCLPLLASQSGFCKLGLLPPSPPLQQGSEMCPPPFSCAGASPSVISVPIFNKLFCK